METQSEARCTVCGATLMNVSSGAVCSESMEHGKIRPPVSEKEIDLARFEDWSARQAIAIRYRSASGRRPCYRYRIDGIGGYVIGRRITRTSRFKDIEAMKGIRALFNGQVYAFSLEAP